MGKFDRRNSQKMKRRKAQTKKKERLARLRAPGSGTAKKSAAPAKKSAKKSAAPKAAV
jgi:hypothetical protein